MTEIRYYDLKQITDGCPMQWEGFTDAGEYLYVRFRHGHWSVNVGGIKNTVAEGRSPDGYDGVCEWSDIVAWALQAGLALVAN
jgi:hypothetical protein